jgi:glutamate-1-semialdehyde 2,1-aminomutase
MFARGILTLGTHNLNYAHSDADIDRLIAAYSEVFPLLADAIHNNALKQYLRCEPLQPLFKVR